MDNLKTKIAKLPKWVQRHIEVLELNLSALENTTAQMFAPVEGEVQVSLPHFHGIEGDQPLPKRQKVQFFTEEHRGRWDGYIEVGIDYLRNEVVVRGADVLHIEPHSSNSFAVKLKSRRRG